MSKSGYYAWAKRVAARAITDRRQRRADLAAKIVAVHADYGCVYGSPRVTDELRDRARGPATASGDRVVYGGGGQIGADRVGDAVAQDTASVPVPDRAPEHVTFTAGRIGHVGRPDGVRTTPCAVPDSVFLALANMRTEGYSAAVRSVDRCAGGSGHTVGSTRLRGCARRRQDMVLSSTDGPSWTIMLKAAGIRLVLHGRTGELRSRIPCWPRVDAMRSGLCPKSPPGHNPSRPSRHEGCRADSANYMVPVSHASSPSR